MLQKTVTSRRISPLLGVELLTDFPATDMFTRLGERGGTGGGGPRELCGRRFGTRSFNTAGKLTGPALNGLVEATVEVVLPPPTSAPPPELLGDTTPSVAVRQ